MAIIGKIRERSFLVLIIIGIALLAFMLTEYFSANSNGQQAPLSIAEINGQQISPQEFDFKVQKGYENYQKQTQQELDERTKSTIRESVWAEMSSDILVGEQLEELGIQVTTRELMDLVSGSNPHPQVRQAFTDPNTGQFNSNALIQFLQNLDNDEATKAQWVEFERALKRNHRMDKYNVLVKKGLYTPSAFAKAKYNENNGAMAFKYIYKPYTSIEDSTVEVSESEVSAFYKKTESDYEQKQSRKIAYAYFPIVPSAEDQAETKQWVNKTYEEFKTNGNDSTFANANSDQNFIPVYYSEENAPVGADTTLWDQDSAYVASPKLVGNVWSIAKVKSIKMAPDSVRARHILIGAQNRTMEVAEKTADSVMTALQAGTSFDSLVSLSDDNASVVNGGDLDWFAEGMMVKPFNDAAFSSNVGEFSKVETQFGFHIIEVTEKLAEVKKIQIATITRVVKPSKDTYADLFNQANSFSISVTDMESFREELTKNNLQQRSAVLAENDNLVQGLGLSRDLARWAKDAVQGDVSEAKDVEGAFVVAIVENVDEEGIAPLDKVRNRVEFLARQEKKAKILKTELSDASDIGSLAGKTGLAVENANVTFASPAIPGVGLEPKVIGTAWSLTLGQLSQPISGNNGVFVISVDKNVSAGEPNLVEVRQNELRSIASRVDNGAVYNALKDKADLVDNRSKFY
ncbi:MAG: peptidyl-prolyl cis-trans isomerase D [Vicingaceae bacterium]|jgi:peptidyl-prolyl cis-trans isomerase D